MSSTIGVQNIAHTNGTNAMTIASGGNVSMASGKAFTDMALVLITSGTNSSAETHDIDNIFSSTYDNYVLKFKSDFGSVTNKDLYFKLLNASGTVLSDDAYANRLDYHAPTGTGAIMNSVQPYLLLVDNANSYILGNLDIHHPFSSTTGTAIEINNFCDDTTAKLNYGMGFYLPKTSCRGVRIYNTESTAFTLSYQVYGYRK